MKHHPAAADLDALLTELIGASVEFIAGRPKDRLMLPILIATLEERLKAEA